MLILLTAAVAKGRAQQAYHQMKPIGKICLLVSQRKVRWTDGRGPKVEGFGVSRLRHAGGQA